MKVELRHLRALAAIGDEGTITDAAIALGISQPALSRTLEQLETRLGTRLVERTTRSLQLTGPGRGLWEESHRLLRQLDVALETATTLTARPLRLGFAWAALGEQTIPFLHSWKTCHPETPVEVRRVADPEAELRRGNLDLAISRAIRTPGDGLTSQFLFCEPRVAAVAARSELAQADTVTLTDVAQHRVVLCSSAATTTPQLWPLPEQPQTFEVANTDEWLTTIALGDAVGVTAASTEQDHPHPGVRYLPITDASNIEVCLLGPTESTHPGSEAFTAYAHQFLTPR